MSQSEKTRNAAARKPAQTGQVRVIGGSRKNSIIRFSGDASLRPTPSAVRETLFNWLGTGVRGARCLDLFAGTGALGFEAASRGAEQVVMVERDRNAANSILQNAQRLKVTGVTVNQIDALKFLGSAVPNSFDIVFLDPPFAAGLVDACLELIQQNKLLRANAVIYVETAADQTVALPHDMEIKKEKTRGGVAYRLLHFVAAQ